jgi:hypothetical protein
MSIQMKVRFIGLVFHAIIVGFAVIILRIMHFVFHAGSDVIGLVVLITAIYVFVNLAMDWFANQPLITRLVARHFVTSDFCKTFEIEPPPPND